MPSDDEDSKIPCKYGASCYQKNPTHLAKFKHPEKRQRSASPETSETLKKQKNEDKTSDSAPKTNENKEKQKNTGRKSEEKQMTDEPNEVKDKQDQKNEEISDEEWVNELNLFETFEDRKKFIKKRFLVEMPEDFYLFWDLCKELNKEKPKEAFKSVGLTLVGPFDILDESFQAGNVSNTEKYFLHWRFYYDPPEFQTIIKGDEKTGYHIGYFRDSPEEKPAFVAFNEAYKNCTITQIGENIFGAVNTYLEKLLKTADPFKKISLNKLQKTIVSKAKELKLNLNQHGKTRKPVCQSFHTAGIVVPYDRSTQLGYRPLPIDDKELKKLLNQVEKSFAIDQQKAFASLQTVLTAATIANDECDFGTALELGINIFCYGSHCYNTTIYNLLNVVYSLLNRNAFAEIISAHIKLRKKWKPIVIDLNN